MPNSSLQRILYIEDDEALARLLQKRMQRQRFTVDIALSAEDGLKHLQAEKYDLLLLDYNLPGMSGLEMLDVLATIEKTPPVIVLTASGDENIALAALEKGAADYAIKDTGQAYLDLLPAVMQAAYTREKLQRENERQRHELEIAKEKAEAANEAKSNFLATMSHEIRTPMNVVTGLARALAKTQLDDQQKKIVSALHSNADLLLNLINDLLSISRVESGQMELESVPFTFTSILNDMQLMFADQAAEKNILYHVEDATEQRMFNGDRTRCQQILMNLVSNAVKFTSQGEISVQAEAKDRGNGRYDMRVRVRDTGIGIPEDKLPLIFEKFTQADETITRRFGGSGLGLSIAKSLTELMGGDITVETTHGKGTMFILTLTLNECSAVERSKIANAAVPTVGVANSGTVLIVEDYAPNIMVATMMLEDLGFTVATAENGRQAIDAVTNAEKPFLAILMDVQMYDMDGLETTRRIRELEITKGQRNTIIGVTAHALTGDRERCIAAGMDDYVSKPIHPDILAAKLGVISANAA